MVPSPVGKDHGAVTGEPKQMHGQQTLGSGTMAAELLRFSSLVSAKQKASAPGNESPERLALGVSHRIPIRRSV
jgi:hypothetical protein